MREARIEYTDQARSLNNNTIKSDDVVGSRCTLSNEPKQDMDDGTGYKYHLRSTHICCTNKLLTGP